MCHTPYGARNAPLDYDAIEAQSKQYRSQHVDTRFVKIFLDGVPTPARTAAMLDPYLPDEAHGSTFRGGIHVGPEVLKQDVTELDRRGYTVKMHAAGDWSVRAGLDAIEAARSRRTAKGRAPARTSTCRCRRAPATARTWMPGSAS